MAEHVPLSLPEAALARPPSAAERRWDRHGRTLTWLCAWLTILTVALLVWQIGQAAAPAVQRYGFAFLTTTTWDARGEEFGILPQLWGTLYSSVLGVGLGAFLGLAVALLLTQDFLSRRWEVLLRNLIDLLAAIPSVVYGLWGIEVLVPALRPVAMWLHEQLGWFPPFATRLSGRGLLPAALVLAIMVLPTVCALARDALAAVPRAIKEAAYGLGATRWEAILLVFVPMASRGICAAVILALGRALGETMALAMLVGNAASLSWSLFTPADTLAALLAHHFAEASGPEKGALMYAALVLLLLTLVVNIVGTSILQRTTLAEGGTPR
jgi:phosphate transport system permease protein